MHNTVSLNLPHPHPFSTYAQELWEWVHASLGGAQIPQKAHVSRYEEDYIGIIVYVCVGSGVCVLCMTVMICVMAYV
ncbi:hypothetical protein EON63_07870 [archaeon]|nr:MAG: hypothetical protein EON63_07870 [archaeon]